MSLNVWQDSPVKPSGPGSFFIKRFLTVNSIFKINIELLMLPISP